MKAESEAYAYHGAMMAANHCVDAMDPREDLSSYRLVIAPRLYCVDSVTADNLKEFVRGGGTLCLTPRSGVVDEYNKIFETAAPGPLAGPAGVEVDDYGALTAALGLRSLSDGFPAEGLQATGWADEIMLSGARAVACYDEGWLSGLPAITVNNFGGGMVVYVGCLLRQESLKLFLGWLTGLAGLTAVMNTPESVRVHERRSRNTRLLFLLNYGDSTADVPLEEEWTDLFSEKAVKEVTIEPVDLRILSRRI